jgi:hypothetical protein
MWENMVQPDGKIYNIILRRKDALRTLEKEKNAEKV